MNQSTVFSTPLMIFLSFNSVQILSFSVKGHYLNTIIYIDIIFFESLPFEVHFIVLEFTIPILFTFKMKFNVIIIKLMQVLAV